MPGEAAALPASLHESAVPVEIGQMGVAFSVPSSVVLLNSSSALDPEITPGYEATPLVKDLVLRLHVDVGRAVQYSHHRLPCRFAAIVEHRNDRAQHSYATTPLSSHCPEIVDSAMATAQGAIAHDHQVELSEVAGSGQ